MTDQEYQELNTLAEKFKNKTISSEEKARFFELLENTLIELKAGLKEDLK